MHQGTRWSSLGNKNAPPEPHYIKYSSLIPKWTHAETKHPYVSVFWHNQPKTDIFINKFKHLEYFAQEGRLFSFMIRSICRCSALKSSLRIFCPSIVRHAAPEWEEDTGGASVMVHRRDPPCCGSWVVGERLKLWTEPESPGETCKMIINMKYFGSVPNIFIMKNEWKHSEARMVKRKKKVFGPLFNANSMFFFLKGSTFVLNLFSFNKMLLQMIPSYLWFIWAIY